MCVFINNQVIFTRVLYFQTFFLRNSSIARLFLVLFDTIHSLYTIFLYSFRTCLHFYENQLSNFNRSLSADFGHTVYKVLNSITIKHNNTFFLFEIILAKINSTILQYFVTFGVKNPENLKKKEQHIEMVDTIFMFTVEVATTTYSPHSSLECFK